MPIDKGNNEAAILVFATPKKPGKGVTPPTPALLKKSKMSGLPDEYVGKEEEECEYCEGKGCPECETESYAEGEEQGGDDMHKEHMGMIGKLIALLEKERD
jgi:hypothetical protein